VICSWPVCDNFQICVRVATIGLKNKQWQATIFTSTYQPSLQLHCATGKVLAKLCAESNHRLAGSFVTYLWIHGLEILWPLATMALFAPNTIAPAFNPVQPPEAPPLFWDVGWFQWPLIMDMWYAIWEKGSGIAAVWDSKCVHHNFFSCCFALLHLSRSHLPSPNSDPNALGNRCAICTLILYPTHTNVPCPPTVDATPPAVSMPHHQRHLCPLNSTIPHLPTLYTFHQSWPSLKTKGQICSGHPMQHSRPLCDLMGDSEGRRHLMDLDYKHECCGHWQAVQMQGMRVRMLHWTIWLQAKHTLQF